MTTPNRTLFEGIAQGGPFDGLQLVSRCPQGVLAVDKPNAKAWVYNFVDGKFQVRGEAMTLDNEKRWIAANGDDYDVLAV